MTEQKKNVLHKIKDSTIEAIDQNGDGEIGIDDIIIAAIKTPGIRVNREAFLRKELFKHFDDDIVDKAVLSNPASAGIDSETIEKIADDVIKFERNCVSGISAALGTPGGAAMIATIPADIIQYYGYTLRAMQKLLYLYGFPEIECDEEGLKLDSGTTNQIILCLGVMNGVAGANNAVKAMAHALSNGVQKQLMKKALTKGKIYPIVKSVTKWFGINLTKAIYTGAIKKAIPVVGGVVGGGITFLSFKPCCERLKTVLQDTRLSNPAHVADDEEESIVESFIDVDYEVL
ncbi:MAG: hypothetical protein ACI4LK_00040 [Lentihominibacter sp.]